MVGVDRVKFYDAHDLAAGYEMRKIDSVLRDNLNGIDGTDVNQIIELYNIKEYIDCGLTLSEWDTQQIDDYRHYCETTIPALIGRYFSAITDQNILDQYTMIETEYYMDFWTLFQKYKLYRKIAPIVFKNLIENEHTCLWHILSQRDIVIAYGVEIAKYMCLNKQHAELLLDEFFKKRERNNQLYFPDQLTVEDREKLISEYIDLPEANPNYLLLVYQSESIPNKLPISDRIKMRAKHAYDAWTETHFSRGASIEYGASVSISDTVDDFSYAIKNNTISFSFSKQWIDDNLDYPTLLNNFIHLFGFVDLFFRCSFVSLPSDMGALEKHLGIKGKKEYIKGMVFSQKAMLTQLQIHAYQSYLHSKGIDLENIFKWFFEAYLPNEFNANGFIYDVPSQGATVLEKCRTLAISMDSVLKQYRMYCEDGSINRELFEISSQHMFINDLPSMQNKKYIYAKSDDIQTEMFLLFSDQSTLSYTEKTKSTYTTLENLLKNERMTIEDFAAYQKPSIEFLLSRDTIHVDDNNHLVFNKNKVFVLKELYQNSVLCYLYCPKAIQGLIDQLIISEDLYSQNTLFSIPEQQYFNYMLNKSEYSNGHDLKNKYTHGTNPHDENAILNDYLSLLKITVIMIIKINEEFCLALKEMEECQNIKKSNGKNLGGMNT